MAHLLIIGEDGETAHKYECANGFVSRCVSAVHELNVADARKVAEILNAHFAEKKPCTTP